MGRNKKNGDKTAQIKPFNKGIETYKDGIHPLHRTVIDEYFNNGFNKTQAAKAAKPDLNHSAAIALTNSILKNQANKEYIREKQNTLKAETNIYNANVLKELINIAFSDPTQFIELSANELKNLPAEQRRTLSAINIKKKNYIDRQGNQVQEENIQVKMTDKIKALDMINKHIGFYAEDNTQRRPALDITKLSLEDQKTLLRILQTTDSPTNE